MGCGKKGYYIKDSKSRDSNAVKGIKVPRDEDKSIRKCLINYFAFYYNNNYIIYKDTKYGASY